MLLLTYLVLAAAVVFLSVKAAFYVDLLDKKTNLSGAFIGGVMLAAVTSLPELFTTLSAMVLLPNPNPNLAIGNILGSNLFNMCILAVLSILFIRKFIACSIAKSHLFTNICVLGMYGALALNLVIKIDIEFFTISLISLIIVALYGLGVKTMANEESDENDEEDTNPLTVKQVLVRFVVTSVLLIASSILVTYTSDAIATKYNLGAGLAGAILLGIATSLPEVTSCVSLMKIGNFNIATGNIVGSSLFNFLILAFADLLYIPASIYTFNESSTYALLIFGLGAAVLLTVLLLLKLKKITSKVIGVAYTALSLGIVGCYIAFLLF